MADPFSGLSAKQRRYVELRLEGLPPKEAGRGAGYAEEYVRAHLHAHLERHPRIKVILRETGRAALKKLCLTREDVLHGLLDAVDTAATATELTMAWREIGKVIGAYEPQKIQIDINDLRQDQLRTMSTEELAALADMQGVFEGVFERVDDDSEEEATREEDRALHSGGDGALEAEPDPADESGPGGDDVAQDPGDDPGAGAGRRSDEDLAGDPAGAGEPGAGATQADPVSSAA